MSIKIYDGWRWRRKLGLIEMTDKIEKVAYAQIKLNLRKLVRDCKMETNRKARYEFAQMQIQHVRLAASTDLRDPVDPNYTFYVRRAGDYYLCMPSDGRRDYTFMKTLRGAGLEDFGYWDNTDMPKVKGLTPAGWKARKEFWLKYWPGTTHALTFSAIDTTVPVHQIMDIMCPDMFSGKKLPKGYWEDK